MRVDAHHHFWDPSRRTYPWMGAQLDAVRRPFGPADLKPLLPVSGIDRTVLVQTLPSLSETRELLATAGGNDFVGGVVGWVDLTDRRVGDTLDELRAGPGGQKLVGVRHQLHDEANPDWLLRDDVQRGIAAVGDAALAFDLLVRVRELPAATETARRYPDMQFVVDHAARPRVAAGPRDRQWEDEMASISELPNVACKLSGFGTEASPPGSVQAQLKPYFESLLDWFGPERCIFGSDWPVCLLAAPYAEVVATTRSLVGDDERVMGATAARVYRLS